MTWIARTKYRNGSNSSFDVISFSHQSYSNSFLSTRIFSYIFRCSFYSQPQTQTHMVLVRNVIFLWKNIFFSLRLFFVAQKIEWKKWVFMSERIAFLFLHFVFALFLFVSIIFNYLCLYSWMNMFLNQLSSSSLRLSWTDNNSGHVIMIANNRESNQLKMIAI